MPKPFTVTPAAGHVSLDRERRARLTFAVTNASGRPMRVRARAVAEQADAQDWLSVAGDVERGMPAGATQQFTVRAEVPLGARAGQYGICLDAAEAGGPAEDAARSAAVTLRVPASRRPRPLPTWLLLSAGVIIALVLGAAAVWLNSLGDGPAVPREARSAVTGSLQAGDATLIDLDSAAGVPAYPEYADLRFVVGQSSKSPIGVLALNDARLAVAESPSELAGCAAVLATRNAAQATVEQLTGAAGLCVRTSAGSASAVTFAPPGGGFTAFPITVSWNTR